MTKVTNEDIEGIKFAKKMDDVIADLVKTVQSNPSLKDQDARVMASCFISMSAQCVLNMAMDRKHWLELCEAIYDSHLSSHLDEKYTSH